jgi:hypothetical protein
MLLATLPDSVASRGGSRWPMRVAVTGAAQTPLVPPARRRGVQQFATDLATLGVVSEPKLKMIQGRAAIAASTSGVVMTLRHGEERIVSYLLASDFHNGATRPGRPHPRYQPAKNLDACSAPFSRPVITS